MSTLFLHRFVLTKLGTRLILIVIAIAALCFLVSHNKNSITVYECAIDEDQEANEARSSIFSSQCNCTRYPKVKYRAAYSSNFHWCSEESSLRGPHQKVIAYTLFNSDKSNGDSATIFRRYFSLLRNISMTASKEYPGWVIRIYHSIEFGKKDEQSTRKLCRIYCRYWNLDLCSVPKMIERVGSSTTPIEPNILKELNPRMFRYLVMLDPDVDVFISRDIDSVIRHREVNAVQQWLQSNYTFHLMRDRPSHFIIMLAGMWGAKTYQRRDLIEGLGRAMIVSGKNNYFFHDQTTLDEILWPVAKFDVMAHDSYHCQNEKLLRTSPIRMFPFPSKREGSYYIGGVGHAVEEISKCPEACRPPDHQDWEYC